MLIAPCSSPLVRTSLTSLATPLGRKNATHYNTHVPANTDVELPSSVIKRGCYNIQVAVHIAVMLPWPLDGSKPGRNRLESAI